MVTIDVLSKFILYSKRLSRPISEIANLWANIQSSMAAAERVFEIMDNDLEIDEGKVMLVDDEIKGYLSFKDIRFSYVKGEEVLKGFNLEVKPGQKISLRENSRGLKVVEEALASVVSRKEYVAFDENTLTGELVRLPERDEFLVEIKENLIVEFYNR